MLLPLMHPSAIQSENTALAPQKRTPGHSASKCPWSIRVTTRADTLSPDSPSARRGRRPPPRRPAAWTSPEWWAPRRRSRRCSSCTAGARAAPRPPPAAPAACHPGCTPAAARPRVGRCPLARRQAQQCPANLTLSTLDRCNLVNLTMYATVGREQPPHLPGFRDHVRGHEVAGPGVDAGGCDSWHACILGPASQVQHVCWHPASRIAEALRMRGPESCIRFEGRQPASNSCAVQAACALLVQPLCALGIVGVVTHVHVRHACCDAGLQHVALCAPLERPGCMDQQVHILQVWSRMRCVAAGSMCAPCIRGLHSRRPADTHRETATVTNLYLQRSSERSCVVDVALQKARPLQLWAPLNQLFVPCWPPPRQRDVDIRIKLQAHTPAVTRPSRCTRECCCNESMRSCSSDGHQSVLLFVPRSLQTSAHAIVAMANAMADCCLPPPVSAMPQCRSQPAQCRQAQARDAACCRCCRCWRRCWKTRCHLCHLAAGFHWPLPIRRHAAGALGASCCCVSC
jgi:hypothetical protein